MRVYRKEFGILKKAASYVDRRFPGLGVNKKQELLRLLYEIAKRENADPEHILDDEESTRFGSIKGYLLKRRFPYSYRHSEIPVPYLCKLDLKPEECADLDRRAFHPKRIFIEKKARDSALAGKFKTLYPHSDIKEIDTLKDHLKNRKKPRISDYNRRCEELYLVSEGHDFFKKCPCTKNALGCGYHIFNLGFGCVFDCAYCYLQEYVNSPGIILPSNMDEFFDRFGSYKRPGMRIGSGEFSDSLMLDDITQYSAPIVDFFGKHPDSTFEFKTKSGNIKNLLKARHAGNIVVSWSLNPQNIIDENELFTCSLTERIDSAMRCARAGYRIGIHFDPVFHYAGWQGDYNKVIGLLFDKVKPENIAWISIGTLRFKPELKPVIERRFPQNRILDEELSPGYDRKMRYPYSIRYGIYKHLIAELQRHSEKLPIYLCMEDRNMWRDLGLAFPKLR